MSLHRAFTLGLAALALAACDGARKVAESKAGATSCVRCHGGEDNDTGAPPRDVLGRSDSASVGAHTKHVDAGIDCGACHVKPARADDGHIDGVARIQWGPLASANGTLTPAFDGAGDAPTYACSSVYCHGAFRGGNAANAPRWTEPGGAACGSCHALPPAAPHPTVSSALTGCAVCHPDTVTPGGALVRGAGSVHANGRIDVSGGHPAGWADPANHGLAAAQDPLSCDACHARVQPAPAGTVSTVTCADCHAGGNAWTTTCNACHGQGDPRGAPPPDVRGNTAVSSVGVGAHRRHVDASTASAPLGCVFCHRGYGDAYDAGHLDGGAVKVTPYTGTDAAWLAAAGVPADPGWDRGAASCATSYCHSAYAPANAPVWTAPRADACGTCHGLPPGDPHPDVGSDLSACQACHPDSIDADGKPKTGPAGKHLDGQITVSGGHVAAWMDTTSPEFHAFAADRGLASCQACHGADLTGGFTGFGCNTCHGATWRTSCGMCHGEKVAGASGAPPRAIWGFGADAVRVGAHAKHLGATTTSPVACGTCHVVPADALSAGHLNTVTGAAVPSADVAFSGRATLKGTGAAWDRATPTCSVYCHGASFGTDTKGTNTAPSWTGGPSEATCGTCHGAPPGGLHPASSACGSCHDGYTATTANVATHIDGTLDVLPLGCAACHGDPARAATELNPQLAAAPPVGTNGESVPTSVAVGAHQLHLVGGPLSDGFACTECHEVPTGFGGDTGHPSGAVELAFGPLAGAASAWNPVPFTCSSTYCHGNFAMGNAAYAPTWTNAKADACGTCHGNPAATATALPVSGHPALASAATNAACAACHPETVDATGAIVAGGKHVDGQQQTLAAANHPAGWSAPALHGAAAAQDGNACLACHAAEPPATVVGLTCAECHGDPGWTTAVCNGCHGEVGDPRGAPPADVAGNTATTFVGVGAHRSHVDGSSVSGPIDCVFCHVKPADVFDAGHLDGGAVKVTAYTGTDAPWTTVAGDPGWTAGTASCATSYCHGNFTGGNATNAPIWTEVGTGQGACGTCHALPPGGAHPDVGTDLTSCATCHPDSIDATGNVKPGPAGKHLDGEVSVTNPHPDGWMVTASPDFHALAANRGLESCRGCHGQDLGGGIARSCASCHDGTTAAAWGCTMCHGGEDNDTGAPPKAIFGQAADPVRVGAHTAHVDAVGLATAIDCGVCHVKPADVLADGHVDPVPEGGVPLASVEFSGIAAGAAAWDRATPTCSVYCHGAASPVWTGGAGEAACGSCHLVPPPAPHTPSTSCGSCHDGYTATSVNPAIHVDGTTQVANLDCFSCHGDRTRPATELNPMLPAAPPVGTRGETQPTDRAVGAHQLHLVVGAVSSGFACETCHDVPLDFGGTSGHPSGTVELAWSGLATNRGALPIFDQAGATCASTYCHGGFAFGNAGNVPIWNAPAADACGTCHGLPPPSPHPASASCGGCHPGYTATTVNLETHVNGVPDASIEGCTGCHGEASRVGVEGADANVTVAPPGTATGRSAGAHLVHVNLRVKSVPAQCAECHADGVPPPGAHPSGVIDVAFGDRAVMGGATPSYDQTAGCSATYCHGNYSGTYTYTKWPEGDPEPTTYQVPYAGNNATASWTGGPTTCGACHGSPPPGWWHSPLHGSQPAHRECSACHPDASGTNATGGAAITNVALHVNGVVDIVAAKSSGTCRGCH